MQLQSKIQNSELHIVWLKAIFINNNLIFARHMVKTVHSVPSWLLPPKIHIRYYHYISVLSYEELKL